MIDLEEGRCFLCESGTPSDALATFGSLGLRQCRCGMVFVSPRLTAARRARIYDEAGYFEGQRGYCSYSEQEPELGAEAERRLDQLQRMADPKGVLLDVGCAYGYLLERAARRGWEVRGVEVSAHVAREAESRLGPGVVLNAPFESADLPERHFSAIVMAHVLEHCADPRASLQRARKLLVPGGVLLVEVPNFRAVRAYQSDRSWDSLRELLRPEYHLYQFTPATLRRALRGSGLDVLKVWTTLVDARAVRRSRLAKMILGGRADEFQLSDFPRARLLPKTLIRAIWQWELALGRGSVIVAGAKAPLRRGA